MKRRDRLMIGLLAAAWAVPLGWGVLFTWVADAADDKWTSCDNWQPSKEPNCFPDDTCDDATFPSAGSPWAVALVKPDLTIGDMDIDGSVDFTTVTDAACIEVETLTISAGSTEIVVTSAQDAEILIRR
ncbi:MAG: hypothetical protein IH986_11120 [Planctomycetes bacterium]|nr:hypothetical protein [Planctomycetota bacterium]